MDSIRKKLVVFLLVTCMIIQITGCSKNETSDVLDTSYEEIKDNDDLKVKGEEELYKLIFDNIEEELNLYDYGSGENIRSVSLKGENQVYSEIDSFNIKNGYAILMALSEGDKTIENKNELLVIEDSENDNKEYILKLFDKELNFLNEISLSDVYNEVLAKSEESETIAVSEDGNQIAFSYFDQIFLYEISSGKVQEILTDTEKVFFEKIRFTRDGSEIVFYGSKVDDPKLYYGMMNKDGTNIVVYGETFKHNHNIYLTDKYAYLNDGEDAYTNTSSGKVILLDLKTRKTNIIKVDSFESTMARVTEDNKFLITGLEEQDNLNSNYTFRQYDINTGKVIYESKIIIKNKEKVERGKGIFDIKLKKESNKFYALINSGQDRNKVVYICYPLEYKEL